MEQRPLVELTHVAEDRVDRLRDGREELNAVVVDHLLGVLDLLSAGIDGIEFDDGLPKGFSPRVHAVVAVLRGDGEDAPGHTKAKPRPPWLTEAAASLGRADELVALHWRPNEDCFFEGVDPVDVVLSLGDVRWLRVSLTEPVGPKGPDPLFDASTCGIEVRAIGPWSMGDVQDALTGGVLETWMLHAPPEPALDHDEPTTLELLIEAQKQVLATNQTPKAVAAGTVVMGETRLHHPLGQAQPPATSRGSRPR